MPPTVTTYLRRMARTLETTMQLSHGHGGGEGQQEGQGGDHHAGRPKRQVRVVSSLCTRTHSAEGDTHSKHAQIPRRILGFLSVRRLCTIFSSCAHGRITGTIRQKASSSK